MPFVRGDIIMPLVWNDNLNQGSYIKINDFVNNLKTIAKKYLGQESCSTYDVTTLLSQRGYTCTTLQSGSVAKQSDINNLRSVLDTFYDNYCNSEYTSYQSTVETSHRRTVYNTEDSPIHTTRYSNQNNTQNVTVCDQDYVGVNYQNYLSLG